MCNYFEFGPVVQEMYSQACMMQAPNGYSRCACLRQVLAYYKYISTHLPSLGTQDLLA